MIQGNVRKARAEGHSMLLLGPMAAVLGRLESRVKEEALRKQEGGPIT